jgi:GNAT superfamily N-acetyltransferase
LTVACAWEPLAALLDDGLHAIVEKHWHEVGVHKEDVPLAVDYDKYRALEAQGILKLMAARQGERLVGYASFIVMPHLHYSRTLHALNDAIFVDPSVRGAGIRLIREAERGLAEMARPGCVRIVYHVKEHVEAARGTLGGVFRHLGYGAFETSYDKVVRG